MNSSSRSPPPMKVATTPTTPTSKSTTTTITTTTHTSSHYSCWRSLRRSSSITKRLLFGSLLCIYIVKSLIYSVSLQQQGFMTLLTDSPPPQSQPLLPSSSSSSLSSHSPNISSSADLFSSSLEKQPPKPQQQTQQQTQQQQPQQEDERTTKEKLVLTTPPPPPPTTTPNQQTRLTPPNTGRRPELFLDRLNRLLPENDTTRRLSIQDIADIEQELLQFNIRRNVTVQFLKNDYISIQNYRWLFHDQSTPTGNKKKCPRCHIRFDRWANGIGDNFIPLPEFWKNNSLYDNGIADVIYDHTCPKSADDVKKALVEPSWQVTMGGCGESQAGSGALYAQTGRQQFDYHAGFENVKDGLFTTSYAHLHFSPDNKLGFPELWNVTDLAKLLLLHRNDRIRPAAAAEPEPAMFVHNNCNAKRGELIREIAKLEPPILVARYKCLSNKDKPNMTKQFEVVPCAERKPEYLFHGDCYEPTRDAGKTVLASFHKFTFSLENTFSKDYFTEKRWQALYAGSVPIVWDNHNSLDFLPDPDAALIVPHNNNEGTSLSKVAKDIVRQLEYYNQNETAFQQRFFEWKKRGLKASFVRKLFLSTDYLLCRICEYISHHHSRGGVPDDNDNVDDTTTTTTTTQADRGETTTEAP